jgi:nucleotide-binding universal stress UspA family protein
MRVLVALDATPRCGEIVAELVARPWPADTFFLLLHVLDPFPFGEAPISLKRAKDGTENQLKEAGRRLCGGGWAMEEDVVFGRARQEIAKVARKWKADLVVVGSNESGAWTRLLLGSTARAVLRHAPCAVEIVRPRADGEHANVDKGMKVLVATDGSECSLTALRSVASRPWPDGSRFKVISIPEPFMPLDQFPQFELKEIENLNTAAIKDARRYADAGAEILQKSGLEASTETPLPRDSDAREIVKEAERWHARMVVLGSHGRHGFDRLTMGSVSEHVALHAPCSVEVIRGFSPPKEKSKRTRGKE